MKKKTTKKTTAQVQKEILKQMKNPNLTQKQAEALREKYLKTINYK